MYNILKCQFKLMLSKKSFWVGFFIITFYALASYLMHVKGYYNKDLSQVLDRRELVCFHDFDSLSNYLNILFPFLVVLPFSMSYFEDCESKMLGFWLTRIGKKRYYISKAMVSFVGSFLIIAIPFLVNLLLVWVTFPDNGNLYDGSIHSEVFYLNTFYEAAQTYWYPFLSIYIFHPFLYNCIYILMMSVLSGVLGVVAYVSSYFIRKHKLLLLLPVYLFLWILTMINQCTDDFELKLYSYVIRGKVHGSYIYFTSVIGVLLVLSVILIRRKFMKDVK